MVDSSFIAFYSVRFSEIRKQRKNMNASLLQISTQGLDMEQHMTLMVLFMEGHAHWRDLSR